VLSPNLVRATDLQGATEEGVMREELDRAAEWVGRLNLHLIDTDERTIGLVEFVVHVDTIMVFLKGKSLAAMVRSHFRQWLLYPWVPMEADEIVWSVLEDRYRIGIGDRGVFDLPNVFVDEMRALI
jgi:hypothetical protein